MTNWHELTGFQRDLLKTALRLAHENRHVSGQDIIREIERNREAKISYGRLYPNLDSLVEAGLLSKGSADQRTNDYQPTQLARESARRELQSWMAIFEREQIVTDGGAERALLWECDSVQSANRTRPYLRPHRHLCQLGGSAVSYRTNCQNCDDQISASYRYCPHCGSEQERAVEAVERMRADAAVSHGPCVKHRCFSCHRIFDSLMHGTDCPHCSGSSICSCENREECQ